MTSVVRQRPFFTAARIGVKESLEWLLLAQCKNLTSAEV